MFNTNDPKPDMSRRGEVDAEMTEPADWADGLTFVHAEPMSDLIQELHPGAVPYRPRGGENDG